MNSNSSNSYHSRTLAAWMAGMGLAVTVIYGCTYASTSRSSQKPTNSAAVKKRIARNRPAPVPPPAKGKLLVGKDAFGSWRDDAPGVRRLIRASDMPKAYSTPSADNQPGMIPRPDDAWPKVPPGFKVTLFASDLTEPRVIVTAPNGDLFVSESRADRLRILRDADGDGKPEVNTVFVTGLNKPFGIAFYPVGPNPRYIYIANTDSVVRYPYRNGQTKAEGAAERIVASLPQGGHLPGGGHWTRDIVFSQDGKKLYVSIGSRTNNDEDIPERAAIHQYNPDGSGFRLYATGIRNPVGLAIDPTTGALWTSVNERDGYGDDLPFEYVTKVKEGGFYGWPWFYIGPNYDPRYEGKHPELRNKVVIPDVLIQAHSASLDLAFYTGKQFPVEYRNDIFVAEHGSWNRARRTGYNVLRVPVKNGKATGEYEDFVTGFVTPEGRVWGRPVSVTTAKDGSLMVTDDGTGSVWRVSYEGNGQRSAKRE